MKTSGIICLCIAIFLILLNILIDITDPPKYNDSAYDVGFFIGSHLFIIVGLVLLIIPFRQYRKSKKIKRSLLNESIENIGKDIQ